MKNKLKGQDKVLHSKLGNMIYIFTFIFLLPFVDTVTSLITALVILLFIGLMKELYDKYYKKTFIDWYDIVASITPYPIIYYINKK
jgi:hypothetical protein|nr:MAG TPA: putative periplasmic lipoprotein [Caudoviricetes sp.]